MLEVKIELKGVDDFIKTHDPKKVALAMHSAMNKTAQQARTYAAKLIGGEYCIQKTRINNLLHISARSSGGNLSAVITGEGMGLPLGYFGPKQVGVSVSKKKGFKYNRRSHRTGHLRRGGEVSVEVRRGARKIVSGSPKPFMTILKSGHIGVFQRTGKGRLPIQQLYGPGVGGLFGSEKIFKNVETFINQKFEPLLIADLKWRFQK
jgi:hypothetical protein